MPLYSDTVPSVSSINGTVVKGVPVVRTSVSTAKPEKEHLNTNTSTGSPVSMPSDIDPTPDFISSSNNSLSEGTAATQNIPTTQYQSRNVDPTLSAHGTNAANSAHGGPTMKAAPDSFRSLLKRQPSETRLPVPPTKKARDSTNQTLHDSNPSYRGYRQWRDQLKLDRLKNLRSQNVAEKIKLVEPNAQDTDSRDEEMHVINNTPISQSCALPLETPPRTHCNLDLPTETSSTHTPRGNEHITTGATTHKDHSHARSHATEAVGAQVVASAAYQTLPRAQAPPSVFNLARPSHMQNTVFQPMLQQPVATQGNRPSRDIDIAHLRWRLQNETRKRQEFELQCQALDVELVSLKTTQTSRYIPNDAVKDGNATAFGEFAEVLAGLRAANDAGSSLKEQLTLMKEEIEAFRATTSSATEDRDQLVQEIISLKQELEILQASYIPPKAEPWTGSEGSDEIHNCHSKHATSNLTKSQLVQELSKTQKQITAMEMKLEALRSSFKRSNREHRAETDAQYQKIKAMNKATNKVYNFDVKVELEVQKAQSAELRTQVRNLKEARVLDTRLAAEAIRRIYGPATIKLPAIDHETTDQDLAVVSDCFRRALEEENGSQLFTLKTKGAIVNQKDDFDATSKQEHEPRLRTTNGKLVNLDRTPVPTKEK